MSTTAYSILWHSGTQGRHWMTAHEASQYAAELWGRVPAKSPAEAVQAARAEGLDVGDWYASGREIHVVPTEGEGSR